MSFTLPNNNAAFHVNQSIWMQPDIDALVAGFAGNDVLTGCAVTAQGSPDMTVAVAAGVVRINREAVVVASGNGTITTADGSNPRIDLVTINTSGTIVVTAGTAAATPGAPAIPANQVLLAMVYVPTSDTTIASNQITDKRVINGEAVVHLRSQTASASATLDFTAISSVFDAYLFELLNVLPATSTDDLWVRLGTGAGPTWDAGGNYTWAYTQDSQIPNTANLGGAADTKIKVGNSLASTSTKGASGDLKFYSPQSALHKNLITRLAMTDSSGNFVGSATGAIYLSTTAVTGVRFLFSTGNIASGIIRMFGVR